MSRDRVLRAALVLTDDGGLEALSMRRLAQALGVEAMSLYNHVASKDDILDGIVELVATEIDVALDEADWKVAMRRRVNSAHDVLSRHPWAASLWLSRRTFGPARTQYTESVLRGLREAGFSKELTYHGFHALQSHVMGFTLYAASFEIDLEEAKALASEVLRDFPADEYPDVAEHIRQHLEPGEEHEGTFAFGRDLILDSLERLRDTTG